MKYYFRFVVYLATAIAFSSARADAYVDFFRAVNIDNASVVAGLLERGFDPNAADAQGRPALFLAVRDESPKVAAVLLAHPRIRVDAANASDETPLMMAAMKGRIDDVRLLIGRGAQINRPGWTPLHYAASGADATAVVALLLERGARIDAPSPNGSTALMMASRYGSWDSAELLLARGADTRVRNQAGLTAADFARLEGRESLARKLEAAVR